ncbi:hypothetical protein [Spirillospora sp. CA-294931]|uniref:hypothetical protein n=1 Tax=Spirillospora sp. CA-294931 TaxID=3240042 RepID=UPI003D8E86F5
MEGIISLVVIGCLLAFFLRKVAVRMRVNAPTFSAVFIVFVIAALALWGQSMK